MFDVSFCDFHLQHFLGPGYTFWLAPCSENSLHVLSLHCILDSALRSRHVLLALNPTATLWGRYDYEHHLIYVTTETQRGCLPKVTQLVIKKQGLEFWQSDPPPCFTKSTRAKCLQPCQAHWKYKVSINYYQVFLVTWAVTNFLFQLDICGELKNPERNAC